MEVVTCGFSKTVVSTFGIPVIMDRTIEEIDPKEYDALPIGKSGVLAGRNATTYHLSNGNRQKQLWRCISVRAFPASAVPSVREVYARWIWHPWYRMTRSALTRVRQPPGTV